MDTVARRALDRTQKMMDKLEAMNDNDLDMLYTMAGCILQERSREYYAQMHRVNSIEEALNGH